MVRERAQYPFKPPADLLDAMRSYVKHSYIPSVNQFIIEACMEKLRKERRGY